MPSITTFNARHVLAALIAAPHDFSSSAVKRLQANDFPNWIHQTIFTALEEILDSSTSEGGALLVQLNEHLLQAGQLKDTDNGLRAELVELANIKGQPEMFASLSKILISTRWRNEAKDYAERILQHIDSSETDLTAALAGLETVRQHYVRAYPFRPAAGHLTPPVALPKQSTETRKEGQVGA